MPKFFVNKSQKDGKKIYINSQDVNHIKNVLRNKVDDIIQICVKETSDNFNCKIVKITNEEIETEIISQNEIDTESKVQVSIFQGIPKSDKMEYIVQKSVELGVYEIIPIELKRCIVKIQEKDKIKKINRWQKISEVAAKQSGRNLIPKVREIINTKQLKDYIKDFDVFIVAFEKEKIIKLKDVIERIKNSDKENKKIGILIGPEGGLEEEEVNLMKKNGAEIITLGNRILRTETVAINILSIIMYELDNI